MNRVKKVGVSVACALGISLVGATFALFRGYFDRGLFEVKQTDWSSSGKVAILAERSDHQALNSDVYFVVIGDHVSSPTELRAAYHRNQRIFAAASDCLSVRWTDAHNLSVSCRGEPLDANQIENVQQHQSGDVAVIYVNIADIKRGKN
jgi:hypothetical protein